MSVQEISGATIPRSTQKGLKKAQLPIPLPERGYGTLFQYAVDSWLLTCIKEFTGQKTVDLKEPRQTLPASRDFLPSLL